MIRSAGLTTALLLLLRAGDVVMAQTLHAGAGVSDITPGPGTPMAGYYAIRLATGTHDPLQAKAIVIGLSAEGDAGEAATAPGAMRSRVALVACDLVALPSETIEKARELAEKATGIRARNIMISATHSHTGPMVSGLGAFSAKFGGDTPAMRAYMEKLPERIAEAVRRANATLRPARISAGTGRQDSIAFNRRFHMKDGTVGWNPGKMNPAIVKPAGPIDPDVNVLQFTAAAGGAPIATYVNYAMHLDTVGGTEWSADYPYALSAELSKAKGRGMVTLFTIGCAGNINHVDVSHKRPQKGHAEAARLGAALAAEVVRTYPKLEPVTDGTIRVKSEQFDLDAAPVTAEELARAKAIEPRVGAPANAPSFLESVFAFKAIDAAAHRTEGFAAEVQAFVLGKEAAIVALPGEVFVELGLAIRKASPFKYTIVVELANGPVTYIPNEPAFAQGNYEVVSSRLVKGAGEQLVETAIRLLKEASVNR